MPTSHPSHSARSASRSSSRRLRVESLESRLAMAGNVVASVVNGHLTIIGDAAANQVFIGDQGNGAFVVRGLTGDTGAATTINGQSEITFQNVTGDLNIDLAAGNDLFYLTADTDWNLGNPYADTWNLGGFAPLLKQHGFAHVSGKLTLNLGDGNDTAVVAGSATGGMLLQGGSDNGNDGLFLRVNRNATTGLVAIDLAGGNDYAALSIDSTGATSILSGTGNDTLIVAYRSDADLVLDTGDGDDNLQFGGKYSYPGIIAGDPLLTQQLNANTATNTVQIRGGAGNDRLDVRHVKAASLIVDSGHGLDTVVVGGLGIRYDAQIIGGGAAGSTIDIITSDIGGPEGIDTFIDVIYLQVSLRSPTNIEGDLSVSFNYDVGSHSGRNRIRIGELPNSTARGFNVTGVLSVYGTIFDDDVLIRGIQAGSITIDTGWGSDSVLLSGISTTGDVNIQLGTGDDYGLIVEDYNKFSTGTFLDITQSYGYSATNIGGNLIIDLGAGDEIDSSMPTGYSFPFFVRATSGTGTAFSIGARNTGLTSNFTVAGQLKIDAGQGVVAMKIGAATFGSIEARLSPIAKSFLDLNVFMVTGDVNVYGSITDDAIRLNGFGIGGNTTVHAGDGDDQVTMNEWRLSSGAQGDVYVYGGNDNDRISIGGGDSLFVRRAIVVDSGANDDIVSLQKVFAVDRLWALLGTGNDLLDLQSSTADDGRFDGGSGLNLVSNLDESKFKRVQRSNLTPNEAAEILF